MERNSFNFEAALRRLGGDRDLLNDLSGYFLEDAPELLRAMRSGLATLDFSRVHRAAHSMKSMVANFDAKDAMLSAHRIENEVLKGTKNADEVNDLCEELLRLEEEVGKLCEALQLRMSSECDRSAVGN